MECARLVFSRHALARMFERGVAAMEVEKVISEGDPIEEYPSDRGLPCFLIPGFTVDGPLHAVVAYDQTAAVCMVVTVYRPDPAVWSSDFRSRRRP